MKDMPDTSLKEEIQKQIQKQPTMFVGLKAVVMNDEDKVLLLKRSSDNTKKDLWDIPGGRIDIGETLEDGLTREVKEETGLDITKIGMVLNLNTFLRDIDKNSQIVRVTFFCRIQGNIQISNEHSEYRWINPKDIGEYEVFARSVKPAVEKVERLMDTSPEALEQETILPGLFEI